MPVQPSIMTQNYALNTGLNLQLKTKIKSLFLYVLKDSQVLNDFLRFTKTNPKGP